MNAESSLPPAPAVRARDRREKLEPKPGHHRTPVANPTWNTRTCRAKGGDSGTCRQRLTDWTDDR